MGNGKQGRAPCGCIGEAVIGQYYECKKCDSVDFVILELPQCPQCGSFNIDEDFEVDPMFYVFNPGCPIINTRCIACGKCWTR